MSLVLIGCVADHDHVGQETARAIKINSGTPEGYRVRRAGSIPGGG